MVSVPGRDKLDFYSRRETKYELDAKGAGEMRRIVEENLPRYEFREGRPSTFITTVYFDTDHLDFYEHASRHYDNNKKIRVKEYYYELEDGSEETFPYCFVEIKKRREGRVRKRRLLVPKKLLGRILKGEDVWEELVRAEPGIEFNGADSTFRQLRHYLDLDQIRDVRVGRCADLPDARGAHKVSQQSNYGNQDAEQLPGVAGKSAQEFPTQENVEVHHEYQPAWKRAFARRKQESRQA